MEAIEAAVEKFRKLLTEQCERAEKMKNPPAQKRADGKIRIGLIDGDGIGPIIMREAKRVLCELLKEQIAGGRVELKEISGLTIENRLRLGVSVPEDTLAEIRKCDVLLKGPTETPKGGTLESANVALRRELDLFSNVRPVRVKELGIDWTFFRENTEGEYVLGSSGVEIPGVLAFDFKVITDEGTRRIARAAFDFARKNGKTHVSIVTKANIMKKTGRQIFGNLPRGGQRLSRNCRRGLLYRHYVRQPAQRADTPKVSGLRPAQSLRRHHHGRGRADTGRRRYGRQRQRGGEVCDV